MIHKIWNGLKSYLKDWKNLLGHGLLGVILLVLAIWIPIKIWIKVVIMAGLIIFNIFRMRFNSKKSCLEKNEDIENLSEQH